MITRERFVLTRGRYVITRGRFVISREGVLFQGKVRDDSRWFVFTTEGQ